MVVTKNDVVTFGRLRGAIEHAGELGQVHDGGRQRSDGDDFAVDDGTVPIEQNDFGGLDVGRTQDADQCHEVARGVDLGPANIPRALGIGDEGRNDRADSLASLVVGIAWVDAVGGAHHVGLRRCL